MMQGVFLPQWIEASSALAVLAILSYVQLRHVTLAILTVLAPLPYAAVAALAFHFSPDPTGYLLGVLSGAVIASGIEARVCGDDPASTAARRTLLATWPLFVWPGILAAALAGVASLAGHSATVKSVGGIGASVISAAVFVFLVGGILPYGENFITRANRARERRDRWLDALAFIVQPRWGWSVSGIGIVLATIGFFGRQAAGTHWFADFGAAEAVIAIAGFGAARSARVAVAVAVTGAGLICLASWMALSFTSAPVLALAMAPAMIVAQQSARFARDGDKPAVALLRSLERHSATAMFFSVGAALALWLFGRRDAGILAACGAPMALLLVPALVTMIYDLLPPRVSLNGYRVR